MARKLKAYELASIHGIPVADVLTIAGYPGARQDMKLDADVIERAVSTLNPQYLEANPQIITPQMRQRQEQARAAEAQAEAERLRQAAIAAVSINSGYNFEGYRIVRYGGYVSGDGLEPVPDGMVGQNGANTLNDIVMRIRMTAVRELKEAANAIGCNAVIGLDFDYINIDSTDKQYLMTGGGTNFRDNHFIGLTANGTAVQIEPIA